MSEHVGGAQKLFFFFFAANAHQLQPAGLFRPFQPESKGDIRWITDDDDEDG